MEMMFGEDVVGSNERIVSAIEIRQAARYQKPLAIYSDDARGG